MFVPTDLYKHICIQLHIRIYIYIYVCVCVYVYTYIYIYTYLFVCASVWHAHSQKTTPYLYTYSSKYIATAPPKTFVISAPKPARPVPWEASGTVSTVPGGERPSGIRHI